MHALKKIHASWHEKGLEMILFFESPTNLLKSSTFHKGISTIPLITYPVREYYQSFGDELSWGMSKNSHLTQLVSTAIKAGIAKAPMYLMAEGKSFNTMPTEFLLDNQYIIRKVNFANALNNLLSLDNIHNFVLC